MATSKKILTEKGLLNAGSFFWRPSHLEPSAWIEHIPFAFWLIENLEPKSLVELGVYNGTSYFSFCQAIETLNVNTKAFGIDTWKGDEHAGFYEDSVYNAVSSYNANKYSKFSTLIRSTFDEARKYFSNKSIDLLHIDGLHTYEAVKHDFENWFPALSENAVVVFHDINVRERNFGVFKFWDEISAKYPHFEFDFGFGLGVLAVGKNYSTILESLFNESKASPYYLLLRNLFAERGFLFKKLLEFEFVKNERNNLKRQDEVFQKVKKELEEKNDELQLILTSSEEKIDKQSDYLKNIIEENDRISRDFTQLQLEFEKINLENSALIEKLIHFKDQAKEMDEIAAKLKFSSDANITLAKKLSQSEERLREMSDLDARLKFQITTNDSLEKKLFQAEEHLQLFNEISTQLNLSSEENSILQNRLLIAEQQISTLQELSRKFCKSEEANSELRKKYSEIANKLKQSQWIIDNLRDQAEEMMNQRLQLLNENKLAIDDLRFEINGINDELLKERAEKSELTGRVHALAAENIELISHAEISQSHIWELNKEILLSNQSAKTMQKKNITGKTSVPAKAILLVKRLSNKFPGSFHLIKVLLFLKWRMQGTTSQNRYKLDFWKYNRHVPYDRIDDYIAIQKSELFNKEWYLSTYSDVQNENADPILHYMSHGYYEGRDPSPSFSTLKYISHYPDVRKDDANPLLHFLYYGKKEGRLSFNITREENKFPYPVMPGSIIKLTPTNDVDDQINHQIVEPMQTPENDFLKRRSTKKNRRDISKIKTVAFIAQPEYFEFHYQEILERMYTVKYFPNSFSENPDFFKSLVEFDADINIFFRGELVPTEVLEALGGLRVNLSSEPFPKIINRSLIYTDDSLGRFEFFVRVFERPYDYIFHYDAISQSFFESQGIELSGYFPFPVVTEIIKPAISFKKWDLFFSGRSTPHRDKFFGPLKRDFNFLHINHGVVGGDLVNFIHQCKASLNIHAENEISWEPRTQFLMAAGSLLISEPLSPTCPLRPGIDFIEVSDPARMYDVCREVIYNYEDYKNIAESGRERIVDKLSSRKNFPEFFNELTQGKYKPASFNKNRFKLEPLKLNLHYNGFQHLLTELLHEHA